MKNYYNIPLNISQLNNHNFRLNYDTKLFNIVPSSKSDQYRWRLQVIKFDSFFNFIFPVKYNLNNLNSISKITFLFLQEFESRIWNGLG